MNLAVAGKSSRCQPNTQLCQKKTKNNPSASEQTGDYCASRHFQRVNSCFLKAAGIKWWTSRGRRSAKAANVVVNSCQDVIARQRQQLRDELGTEWDLFLKLIFNTSTEQRERGIHFGSFSYMQQQDTGFKERDTGLISVLMVMSVKTPIFDPKSQFITSVCVHIYSWRNTIGVFPDPRF